MSPGNLGQIMGVRIEREVGCKYPASCDLPGGFWSGLIIPP